MDPYLENPALWPDVHNSLMVAMRDVLAPSLAPNYYVGIEQRMYVLKPEEDLFIGRTDVGVTLQRLPPTTRSLPLAEAGVLEVLVPMEDEVGELFLEVRELPGKKLVTTLEMLSPVNKFGQGRRKYLRKREGVFNTRTHLVEVDLLRAGEPMPTSRPVQSDYRILVSRGSQRPRAQLYAFHLRQPIPPFHLPLLPGDAEPLVDLNTLLHDLYARARFDVILDYAQPPVPPLREEDADWARELIHAA